MFGEAQIPVPVTLAHELGFARSSKLLLCELANRLQETIARGSRHSFPRLLDQDHGLRHQATQELEDVLAQRKSVARNSFCCFERPAANKDR
jgi:hypothetical protein